LPGIRTDPSERERAVELHDALNRICGVVHSALDPEEILRRLVSEGARALACDTAAVSVRSSDGWTVRYVHGLPETLVGATMLDREELHAVQAMRTGQPVAVFDAFNDERFNREHLRRHNIRSVLVVPLVTQGRSLGVLFFNYHRAAHEFTEAEIRLARHLASTASTGLENARLYEEARRLEQGAKRKNMVLLGIARIFREALTCETPEQLGRTCLTVAEEITGSKFGFIAEINHETGKLHDIAISDPGWDACRMANPAGHGQRAPFVFTIQGIYGRVLKDGMGSFTNDPSSHPDSIGSPKGHPPLESFLGVPLISGNRTIGIMGLGNREGGYGHEDLEAAESLAPAIVQAFESKRTERALASKRELLESIFGNIPIMLVTWDPQLRRFTLNQHAEAVLGWSTDEVNRGDLMEMVYPDAEYRREVTEYMQSLQPGFREWICRTKEGRDIPTEWANVRLTDRTRIGIGVDLRARKQAEESLSRANRKLLDIDRRKNEFMAALSHELRNPLAPIRYSLAVLNRSDRRGVQAGRALEVIDRQVTLLTDLVSDLLDVSRITHNRTQIRKRPLDLVDLVHRAVEDNRPLFDKAGVHLELCRAPGPIPVNADGTRLSQIIGNLLQNAAQFSQPGGRTRVSVRADGDTAETRVADNGLGMSLDTLDRLFEPFMKADEGLDRGKGGLGLGLALCKGLTELHGGSISAHSEGVGQGSEFCLRLPLTVLPLPQEEASATAASTTPWRILIIEDHLDAGDSLCMALEEEGHQVVVARDGHEGLAKARLFRPELVLCDIGLPGMDGYEVARRFREDERLADTFLVALSGYALPGDVRLAIDAGFDYHVAKPSDLEQITRLLTSERP
jgi:PAS domain S-box-containing protein